VRPHYPAFIHRLFIFEGLIMSEVFEAASHIKYQLHSDLRCVLTNVDLLLKAMAERTGEQVTAVRDRLDRNLKGALERLAQIDATLGSDFKRQVHTDLHQTSEAVKLVVTAAEQATAGCERTTEQATRTAKHNAIDYSQESVMRAIHEIVSRL
jgi:ElaB/YqjD/DUF883 family membrane-anchored ribosome-binding protein